MRRWVSFSLVFFAVATAPFFASAEKAFPPSPSHYVYDETGSLSRSSISMLSQQLQQEEQTTSHQIVVALFKSLEGEDLVDYTHRLFQEWKVGQEKTNNGVLLAVYFDEKKSRIEVGYGLEGVLTDAMSKRILTEILSANFREGKIEDGILQSTAAIIKVANAEKVDFRQKTKNKGRNLGALISLLFFLYFIFYRGNFLGLTLGGMAAGGISRRSGFGGGSFGGGGFGGGFGGGGGISGGGGASGSW